MVSKTEPLFNAAFDRLCENIPFLKKIWCISQLEYSKQGKGMFLIYYPSVEFFFSNRGDYEISTKYVKQSLLDDDDQQVLNQMADNQIAVGLLFKRENTRVATFLNNIFQFE